ncbi:MAG: hypothetical protein ACRCU6_02070, partial [Fusobacteriaceae bacterium]
MPLIVISGKHDFLSSRYLNTLLEKSKNPGIYDSPLNMAGSFDGADLVVIHNPEDMKDLSVYSALNEIKDLRVVLFFLGDVKGNTKVGKFIASLPKEQHKTFPLPPPWKLHGEACSFLLEEVKKYGKTFSHEKLSSLLIERVGTDLGVLSYELLKLVHASDPEKTITPEHFKGSLSLVFDVGLDGLVDGLRHRDTKKVAKSLYAINPSMKKESLFRILGYL